MIQKKVCMVGTSGVGKTSLVAKFVHRMFSDKYLTAVQYNAIEYPSHCGWGHTCVDDTVQLAARAGAEQLSLFHHDPDHDDGKIAEMVACGQREVARSGASLRVGAASEGAEIKLARAISL